MKEESPESKKIRLRNYKCIAAGEEAVKGIFDNDKYWKIFWEAYIEKLRELS